MIYQAEKLLQSMQFVNQEVNILPAQDSKLLAVRGKKMLIDITIKSRNDYRIRT